MELTFAGLTGKTAVVTGSSSGIGRAIAIELARAGADVGIHAASNRTGAEKTAADVQQLGRQSLIVMRDLRDGPTALDEFVDQFWQWQNNIDVWVNCAGVDLLTGDASKLEFAEKLQRILDVDVAATMHISRAVGARMSPGASILTIGWDQAPFGMEGDSGEIFSSSKAAVMAFTKSLARSLAPDIRVNCIAPGWIKTAWGEDAAEGWQRRAVRESLLGRWGTPEDVAAVARFLASHAASFMTGQIVEVNGGFRGSAPES